MNLPVEYNSDKERTLVQAYDGKGAYIKFDEEGNLVSLYELDRS